MGVPDILRRDLIPVMFWRSLYPGEIPRVWPNTIFNPNSNLITIQLNSPGNFLDPANHKTEKTETDHPDEGNKLRLPITFGFIYTVLFIPTLAK